MIKRIIEWLKFAWKLFLKPTPPPEIPPPYIPAPEVYRDQAQAIGPDITVVNHRDHTVILEGTLLRRLTLKPGEMKVIKSPILEPYHHQGKLHVREWDAEYVLNDMIKQWMLGLLYDEVEVKKYGLGIKDGEDFDLRAQMKLNRRVNVCGIEVMRVHPVP